MIKNSNRLLKIAAERVPNRWQRWLGGRNVAEQVRGGHKPTWGDYVSDWGRSFEKAVKGTVPAPILDRTLAIGASALKTPVTVANLIDAGTAGVNRAIWGSFAKMAPEEGQPVDDIWKRIGNYSKERVHSVDDRRNRTREYFNDFERYVDDTQAKYSSTDINHPANIAASFIGVGGPGKRLLPLAKKAPKLLFPFPAFNILQNARHAVNPKVRAVGEFMYRHRKPLNITATTLGLGLPVVDNLFGITATNTGDSEAARSLKRMIRYGTPSLSIPLNQGPLLNLVASKHSGTLGDITQTLTGKALRSLPDTGKPFGYAQWPVDETKKHLPALVEWWNEPMDTSVYKKALNELYEKYQEDPAMYNEAIRILATDKDKFKNTKLYRRWQEIIPNNLYTRMAGLFGTMDTVGNDAQKLLNLQNYGNTPVEGAFKGAGSELRYNPRVRQVLFGPKGTRIADFVKQTYPWAKQEAADQEKLGWREYGTQWYKGQRQFPEHLQPYVQATQEHIIDSSLDRLEQMGVDRDKLKQAVTTLNTIRDEADPRRIEAIRVIDDAMDKMYNKYRTPVDAAIAATYAGFGDKPGEFEYEMARKTTDAIYAGAKFKARTYLLKKFMERFKN